MKWNPEDIRALKTQATRREYRRVFDDMNMPPRDIVVEHESGTFVREAWQVGNKFGWFRWKATN